MENPHKTRKPYVFVFQEHPTLCGQNVPTKVAISKILVPVGTFRILKYKTYSP